MRFLYESAVLEPVCLCPLVRVRYSYCLWRGILVVGMPGFALFTYPKGFEKVFLCLFVIFASILFKSSQLLLYRIFYLGIYLGLIVVFRYFVFAFLKFWYNFVSWACDDKHGYLYAFSFIRILSCIDISILANIFLSDDIIFIRSFVSILQSLAT